MVTINELKQMRESEDAVEFKAAKTQYSFNSDKKSVVGYSVALANEGGGFLVLGIEDKHPHNICGSKAFLDATGKLEQDVYDILKLRVKCHELFEGEKRVLVIEVPKRPVGKVLYFNDVPLMRVGDALKRMSAEVYLKIIQEQEPDFSAKPCEAISLADLDDSAVNKLKILYADRQENNQIAALPLQQLLSDLGLQNGSTLNYAALVLLGKSAIINKILPQCKIVWEYRGTENQIEYDNKETITAPLFLGIDKIWDLINQPVANKQHNILNGPYALSIRYFDKEVVREALLNAIAHRDYTVTSEIVVKQFPEKLVITNPGGFPKGVNLGNLLTVNSTPRSRTITEILEKTGLVERSGQGVDKIYYYTLLDGKPIPDYSKSDINQVELTLSANLEDDVFTIFISNYLSENNLDTLGVHQIIGLYNIKNGNSNLVEPAIIDELLNLKFIEKSSTSSKGYLLAPEYYALNNSKGKIGKRYVSRNVELLVNQFTGNVSLKVGELANNVEDVLSRNQVKFLLQKLIEDDIVDFEGKQRGRRYSINSTFLNADETINLSGILNILKTKYDK